MLPRAYLYCGRKTIIKYVHRRITNGIVCQILKERCVLRVSGSSVKEYIQGLITNDIEHLRHGSNSMYTLFLNAKGRIICDSIIYSDGDNGHLIIECDNSIAHQLVKHINLYKIRRKIDVDISNDITVWNINYKLLPENIHQQPLEMDLRQLSEKISPIKDVRLSPDPRVSLLGLRALVLKGTCFVETLRNLLPNVESSEYYTKLRYRLGVPEGPEELPTGACFPLEGNADYMHGVSFHKGCYIGQELTARTHHTGVVRKRIMPLFFDSDASFLTIDSAVTCETGGKNLGKLRGVSGTFGIGLLRIQEVLQSTNLQIGGLAFKTLRPIWWPSEAPKERLNQ